VYPIIKQASIDTTDALRTYTEHIAIQIRNAIEFLNNQQSRIKSGTGPATSNPGSSPGQAQQLLATGGGAFNTFLLQRLKQQLEEYNIEVIVPDKKLVNFKEAIIMAFIGVLRWRQEYNVLSSVTGAARNSIGGALWTGQEA